MNLRQSRKALFVALLLSAAASGQSLTQFPYDKGIRVKDEGVGAATLANQARGVTCQGSAVACWVDGGWWFLDVSATSDGGGTGAPTNASYITEVAESGLSNEFAMASLGTGLVKNTTTTGVPSIYAGTSCSNQFPRSLSSSGAATCASVSLTADVTGTLPEGNGGTGAGALSCTSGQCLTSNGSAYSCTSSITANDLSCSSCVALASEVAGILPVANGGTGSAPAGDDQVLVSDSSSAATWKSLPNCTDTGGNHLNYSTATNGWSCGTSQLHDVGGSSPQVQYNNSGSLGGIANVQSDGTRLSIVGETSHPSPPAGDALLYNEIHSSTFPPIPFSRDSFMGIPMPVGMLGAFLHKDSSGGWMCQCTDSNGWGDGTQNVSWNTPLPTTTGNTTAPAWASTSLFTRSRRTKQATAGAINNAAGLRAARQSVWRGNAAGTGGWVSLQRWGTEFTDGGSRVAIGFFNKATAFSVSADPNVELNSVYVGCNSGDVNLSACSNDNSGTATCNTLGSNFPCVCSGSNVNLMYDVGFAASPYPSDGGTFQAISYSVDRLDVAHHTDGVISSDLPQNTVQMGWQEWVDSGPWAGTVDLTFFSTCICANP